MLDLSFKLWFYLPDREVLVGVPAKCGGTSFYRAVFAVPPAVPDEGARGFAVRRALDSGRGPFAPYEVDIAFDGVPRLLAVREPVDRFASLWRDKCRRSPGPTLNSTEYLRGWTQEQLLDLVERFPFGDPHWAPQYVELVPDVELVRYDRLPERLGYAAAPPANRTRPRGSDPEPPRERILAHYAQDVWLWERAKG